MPLVTLTLVVMGCKVLAASSGGCTHFLTTPDAKGGIMTVGFGQGCVSGACAFPFPMIQDFHSDC